jgi:peptide-methionine (R)-S-oxide reductase
MNDSDYKQRLTPMQYAVTREKATEPPFTGEYWDTKREGVYICVCCGAELFSSATKYDSGTGWPSFWAPVEGASLRTESDRTLGMERTEVICGECGAHLGHLFPDGPRPTGLRYCLNSASFRLDEKKAESDER